MRNAGQSSGLGHNELRALDDAGQIEKPTALGFSGSRTRHMNYIFSSKDLILQGVSKLR